MGAAPKNNDPGGAFNLGRLLVYSASFMIVIAGLREAASFLIPVLMAVFVSVLLAPPFFNLQKRMPAWAALAVMIVGMLVLAFGFVGLISGAVQQFQENLYSYKDKIEEKRQALTGWVAEKEQKSAWLQNIAAKIYPDDVAVTNSVAVTDTNAASIVVTNMATTNMANVGTNREPATGDENLPGEGEKGKEEKKEFESKFAAHLGESMTGGMNVNMLLDLGKKVAQELGSLLGQTFLVVLYVVFILLEASVVPAKVRNLPGMTDENWARLEATVAGVRSYTAIKTWLSLLTGFFVWAMLVYLGVSYAILFGLLAFILNYIPNVGSLIAAIPAVIVAFLELEPWWLTLVVIAGFVFVNTVVGNVIEPKVLDRGLGLSASIIVVTMVFWSFVLGPVGMLLSVPLTMIAKIGLDASNDTQWIGAMMGSGDDQPDEPEPTA
jgi:AI-2 transport protein TqsA